VEKTMNEKLENKISEFLICVEDYVAMEYSDTYASMFWDEDCFIDVIYPMITSYYLGGNNVPNTAHDLINRLLRNSR
jgi:hypothetical protein